MHILTVVNGENPSAYDASMLLAAYFSSQGIGNDIVLAANIPTPEEVALGGGDALSAAGIKPFDLAVALGGDGTILRTARVAMLFDAPVMGINFGHLGFLANPSDAGVVPMVAAALAGDVTEDRRTSLLVKVVCEGDGEAACAAPVRGFSARASGLAGAASALVGNGAGAGLAGAAAGDTDAPGATGGYEVSADGARVFTALNEVIITRGSNPRNLEIHLGISGDDVCTLRGDGIIVATATGSTAYALSAGGPLVSPGLEGMVVVPLATHTLQSRAIVTERHDVVEAGFDFAEGYTFAEIQLDGTTVSFPTPIERVEVCCDPTPARLLFYRKESFYSRISRTFF